MPTSSQRGQQQKQAERPEGGSSFIGSSTSARRRLAFFLAAALVVGRAHAFHVSAKAPAAAAGSGGKQLRAVVEGGGESAGVLPTSLREENPAESSMSAIPPGSGSSSEVVEHALAWSCANGLSMVVDEGGSSADGEKQFTTTHVPFSLFPNALPRHAFEEAVALAPLFGRLVEGIANDGAWLGQVLGEVIAGDDFTARLVKIFDQITAEGGPVQPLNLGIHRSDYMLHDPPAGEERPRLLQVEMNTIASSFGCVSSVTSSMHRHLISRYGDREEGKFVRQALEEGGVTRKWSSAAEAADCIPSNPSLTALPDAIAHAHSVYCEQQKKNDGPPAVVVFVVQPGESNAVDQRFLEFGLWDKHEVPVKRLTLAEIQEKGRLNESAELVIDGQEVSVVYFRAGYTPRDFPGEEEWAARLLVERSRAIKCPSIAYHLAGTKKVQQVLAQAGEVERFLPDGDDAERVRACFAGLYSVGYADDERAAAAVAEAQEHPEGFVLKPQREGGGNNLYGAELVDKLRTASQQELRSFILMQRILPKERTSTLVKRGQTVRGPALSEWGFYSTYLGGASLAEPLRNEYAGFLVRTKLEGVDEGGVASGFAVLSSPMLTDDEADDTGK